MTPGIRMTSLDVYKRQLYGIPMQVPPVTVVGNTDIPHGALQGIRFDGGDGKSQFTVRFGNGTAVAVGLLHIVVVLFYKHFVVCQQFGVILYGEMCIRDRLSDSLPPDSFREQRQREG